MAREPENRVKCGSNLRQIDAAIRAYADDNAGALPPDFVALLFARRPLDSRMLCCPSSSAERTFAPTPAAAATQVSSPDYCSYHLAHPLPPTRVALTAAHVVAYEPPENHSRAGIHALYGDGRVVWLAREQADHVATELKAGHNPPRPQRTGQPQ